MIKTTCIHCFSEIEITKPAKTKRLYREIDRRSLTAKVSKLKGKRDSLIRDLYDSGEWTIEQAAVAFGLSCRSISTILGTV